jgi:3-deoxy-7-phosphoheptulonate synthase
MIIKLKQNHSSEQTIVFLNENGYTSRLVETQSGRYLVAVGSNPLDIRTIGLLPDVEDVFRVSDPYKLVSKKWRLETSKIEITQDINIGLSSPVLMMGPCSLESEEQMFEVANFLYKKNIRIMRAGAFKPRSSTYSFQGMGIEGLKTCANIATPLGIKLIGEVMEPSQIDQMYDYIDIFQVGARNSQNFSLLNALGSCDKTVLLKRGISGTIDELLQSAEYIFANGNEKILLCERGIRTYETAYRNTLDINSIPVLKEKSHLPVIVDPSHGIGIRRYVEAVSLAAIMAGADGLLVECHPYPEKAYSDGAQTLNFVESERLIDKVNALGDFRNKLNQNIV